MNITRAPVAPPTEGTTTHSKVATLRLARLLYYVTRAVASSIFNVVVIVGDDTRTCIVADTNGLLVHIPVVCQFVIEIRK
jgi:hypothetical protein